MNDCAPPASSLSPGGVRIAALLLGAIVAPHEASSQLARASEVTWSSGDIAVVEVGDRFEVLCCSRFKHVEAVSNG